MDSDPRAAAEATRVSRNTAVINPLIQIKILSVLLQSSNKQRVFHLKDERGGSSADVIHRIRVRDSCLVCIQFVQLMASRYIQKYPVPNDFPLILKNFSREILRDQPTNIIEYAAKYFQALESGQPFKYQSAFNVPKEDKQYELEYKPQKADEMVRKELRINQISGAISKKQMEKITRVVDNVFLKYDTDKSGNLQLKELGEMLKALYKQGYIDVMPTDGQVREFSTEIDKNSNGLISKGELSIFIRKLIT